ncbi:MAG: DMT family transporter [Arenicellales bacterium WSBS_2016_MAG_OTU3]
MNKNAKAVSSKNIKAAGVMMLAMTLIACNDAIIKTVSESLPVGQLLFLRGLLACLILASAIKLSGRPVFPREMFIKINLLRATGEMCATLCFVTGLSLLPIATASALVWTAPILLTIFAAVYFKERVSCIRWSAVLFGFIGVLLVTNPFGTTFSWTLLLPIAAAFFVAIRDMLTRGVSSSLHSFYITLPTLMIVTLVGAVLSLFSWSPVSLTHFGMLAVSAMFLSAAFFFQIQAIRTGELSFVAPFSFTGIMIAIILGAVIWNQLPSASGFVGIGLIILAGLVIVLRGNHSQSN